MGKIDIKDHDLNNHRQYYIEQILPKQFSRSPNEQFFQCAGKDDSKEIWMEKLATGKQKMNYRYQAVPQNYVGLCCGLTPVGNQGPRSHSFTAPHQWDGIALVFAAKDKDTSS